MKKLLIILLAFGFLLSCKSKENSEDNKTENRAKDDSKDKKDFDTKQKGNLNATDLDEDGNSKADVESITGQDDSEDFGWPQSERDAFVTSCVREATKAGRTRSVSQRYCDCMLGKIEGLYPDIKVAAKLTNQDVNDLTDKFAKGCLR